MRGAALQRIWYDGARCPAPLGWAAGLYALLATRNATRQRAAAPALPLPVIVVGNISVGGTGKTPLVIWLVERLRAAGLRPGVVSRGYGGRPSRRPLPVTPQTDPGESGDEPLLIAQRCAAPVVVDPDRVAAVQALAARRDVDVVVSDDGLQHLRMQRVVEIAVVDGARGLGNRRRLPAGPLREPPSRLGEVDLVVVNGDGWRPDHGSDVPWCRMRLIATHARRLDGGGVCRLDELRGRRVRAIAGIGHPARFFAMLAGYGIDVVECPFADHHRFRAEDLRFDDGLPLLMTEKDAVKVHGLAPPDAWSVPVQAQLDAAAEGLVRQWAEQLRRPIRAAGG